MVSTSLRQSGQPEGSASWMQKPARSPPCRKSNPLQGLYQGTALQLAEKQTIAGFVSGHDSGYPLGRVPSERNIHPALAAARRFRPLVWPARKLGRWDPEPAVLKGHVFIRATNRG